MTTPNLDALAKRSPFRAMCGEVWPERGSQSLSAAELMAIANEWADLRAYRERTEAALVDHSAGVRDLLNDLGWDKPLQNEMDALKEAGLWREPGQGAT